jgi:hypothetical protein
MGPGLRRDDESLRGDGPGQPGDDGTALYVSTWNPPNVDFATSES